MDRGDAHSAVLEVPSEAIHAVTGPAEHDGGAGGGHNAGSMFDPLVGIHPPEEVAGVDGIGAAPLHVVAGGSLAHVVFQ